MLTKLRLKNFKNFKDVEFEFGGLTLLVGTNAVGKSNVCEALRFLSAMGRGYTLAQAIGGHYENGTLQWRGIRGWMSEIAFYGESTFSIEATFDIGDSHFVVQDFEKPKIVRYSIEVVMGQNFGSTVLPKILSEKIVLEGNHSEQLESYTIHESDRLEASFNGKVITLSGELPLPIRNDRSLISQINIVSWLNQAMSAIRDFDWDPKVMRDSVLPGYDEIGDRGEGLSSVLHSIFQQDHLKEACTDWLNALTPMDVTDLEFVAEESGKIALRMIESNGRKISAASASDGTLRFLATLAAYFSPITQQLYFLEELENGIHPTRLHLLLQLIEQRAEAGKIQTIATTHSPQLLRFLSEESLQHAYVIYRSDDRSDAQVRRIVDIPNIREVLETTDLGELLESGWLETTLSFERDEERVAG
jgi:predicted ATPase